MSEYKTNSFLPCDEAPAQMSKRFYAACCAMQGLLANPSVAVNTAPHGDIISDAYKYADELLKQE